MSQLFTSQDSKVDALMYSTTKMTDAPTIYKEFSNVSCGKKFVETFRIENKSKANKVYEVKQIKRSQLCEYFDNRIQIHPHSAVILPRRGVQFSVLYCAYTENVINNFYYDIVSGSKVVAHLNISAKSVGPCIDKLTHDLKFFVCRGISQNVKFVELLNTAKCEAKFCFDVDENNQMIEVSEWVGVIPPNGKTTLKITFKPAEPGVFYKQIYCLIQYHEPILFKILGVYKPKLKLNCKSLTFHYPQNLNYKTNYEDYMFKYFQDNVPIELKIRLPRCLGKVEPLLPTSPGSKESEDDNNYWDIYSPASRTSCESSIEYTATDLVLTTNYIDVRNQIELCKATTLANLSKNVSYSFQWDHDPKNNFQIEPCKGVLGPNERADFALFITPSVPDTMYHMEANLRIFPTAKYKEIESFQTVYLPLTKTLRIIGHSFPDDSCGWIPQCRVTPKVLHLRSCVPNEVSYGTVLLERQGHLPISFTVIPAKDSNFSIRPPLGFLSREFQIFVIQFNGRNKQKGLYQEELKITYNNSSKNFSIVKVIISVEIPLLYLGKNNSFTFEAAFPGTKSTTQIPVVNPTNLLLSYYFEVPEEVVWLDILEPKGIIQPMSSIYVGVVFQPEMPCEYLDYVPCTVASVTMPDFTQVINLKLIGSCQYGYLVATPSVYDFGECNYKEKKKVTTHLFNFSAVLLHFKLKVISTIPSLDDYTKDVKIIPSKGSVPAKKSMKVQIEICPSDKEEFEYAVLCQNLDSNTGISYEIPEEPRVIFSFKVTGVLPTFSIIDVNVDKGGPLFSPHWIWKMMNVNKINKELKSLKSHECIPVKCPDAMVNSNSIKIALLLEANQYGSISCDIVRKSLCNCNDSIESYEIKNDYDCPHEKYVTVNPTKFTIEAKKRIILQIILNYSNLGEYKSDWIFQLPYKRRIILRVEFSSLSNEKFCGASLYELPVFNLKSVFIGDPEPPFQLFWLYNNTHEPTSYLMDRVTLRNEFAAEYRVLDCLNPMGVIPPFSSVPLIFHFKPLKIDFYEAEVQLCIMEDKIININMSGSGLPYFQQIPEFCPENTVPKTPILFNSDVALEFSVHYINITFLKTFCQVRRIFYIRNRSKSEKWAFYWHYFQINDIVKAWVEPRAGIVKPQQEIAVFLVVQSYSQPSYINMSIPCDVINDSKRKKYEKAVHYEKFLKEATKDNFTITEKGTSYEAPDIKIPVKPDISHLFLTVSANILTLSQLDQKLFLSQQLHLPTDKKFLSKEEVIKPQLSSAVLPSLQFLYEKLIWSILCGTVFKEKINLLESENEFCYLQLKADLKNKTEARVMDFTPKLSRSCVQKCLESSILTVLTKEHFFPDEKN